MFRSITTKLHSNNLDNVQILKNLIFRCASTQATAEKPKVDLSKLDKIKIPESQSFIQNIFTGEARVDNFFPYPQILSEDELSFIEMANEPISRMWNEKYSEFWKIEDSEQVPEDVLEMMKNMGSFGIQVPVEYGGMGCNNTQYARLAEIAGQYDLGVGIVMGAHQSIGYKGLVIFGTPEQKERYLPALASGESFAAFALTEPSAGSDASGIKSRAVLSEDGSHWILNGSKIYISNGGFADYMTVFAKTPRGPGVTSGPNMKKMGIKLSNTTEVWFDNVKIPHENVIGEVGDGFKVAMKILNNGRYGMCCALSGTMRKAIEMATKHCNNRSQFGNKLSTYTGIQEKIARMTMLHYLTQSHAYMLSGIIDYGMPDFQLEAAAAKVVASDSAWAVVDDALQLFGGMGYIKETGIEKILRDTRIFRIFEGTNEILRMFIALTGLQYAGGHLRELQRAMKNPVANLGMIFGEGSRRIRRSVGLTTPNLSEHVHPHFHTEVQLLAKNIILFSTSVEQLLIKYNRNIVMEQMLLTRLANAAIDIYSMLVVLSRCSRSLHKNLETAEYEENICRAFCSEANIRIDRNLDSLKSSVALRNDELLRKVAVEVLKNEGLVHDHPLG